MQIKVKFRLDRITKGAIRYHEVNELDQIMEMNNPNTVIGVLYLRKAGISKGAVPITAPRIVTITLDIEVIEREGWTHDQITS